MHDMHDFKSNNIPRLLGPSWCSPCAYPLGHKISGGSDVNARDVLKRAADSGVELYLAGNALKVRGYRDAVEILSSELRIHKAAIVELLSREAVNDPAAPELKITPSAQPPDLTQPPAPAPDKPAKPRKQTFMEHADTWLHLDRAYQAHHFKCPTCKAAGLGYGLRCGTGAALYRAYSDASGESIGLDW